MIIIPAIDLRGRNVVRLIQGDFHKEKIYSTDPVAVAKRWVGEGAKMLHVVDLDGALEGKPKNTDLIFDIAEKINIPIQVGGGIRSMNDINKILRKQVWRVVMGTKAFQSESMLKEAISEYPERVIVAIDSRDGSLVVGGWLEETGMNAFDFAKKCEDLGVKEIVYTDVKRDGMLTGPNFDGICKMVEKTSLSFIVSGGVSELGHIRKLREISETRIKGVIIGKALYDGVVNFTEAKEIAEAG